MSGTCCRNHGLLMPHDDCSESDIMMRAFEKRIEAVKREAWIVGLVLELLFLVGAWVAMGMLYSHRASMWLVLVCSILTGLATYKLSTRLTTSWLKRKERL